jgi:glutamate racemase
MKRGIKALVVACNTATAAAIDFLREKYPDFIIIGIEPAVKPAVRQFPTGSIGIMATPVTLREEKLRRLLAQNPHPNIHSIPAPGLVELVEAGLANSPQMDAFLAQLLAPYKDKLDGLVLGCTHYPFASAAISRALGGKTVLFDGGAGTANHTKRRLTDAGLLNPGEGCVLIENSLPDEQIIRLCNQLLTEENYG